MNFEYKMINGKTTLTVNGKPVDLEKYKSSESINEIINSEVKKQKPNPIIREISLPFSIWSCFAYMDKNKVVLNAVNSNERNVKLDFSSNDIKILYEMYYSNIKDFDNIILKQYRYQSLDNKIHELHKELNNANEEYDKLGRVIDSIMDKYDK